MTAFTVQGIDHVVLRVVDVEGVIRFYQDVLGCAVERRKDDLGLIQLRCWQDSRGVHFSVTDSGYGFDPIHIPHLTERFYRIDPSRNNASGGSGLGLAIVKHVLINHKGSLEVHSEEGKGSEFICHFPLSLATPVDEINVSA